MRILLSGCGDGVQVGGLPHAVGPPAAIAAPLAVTWASEGGLQPDPVTVEAALEASDTFCEDVFFRLLAALGVPDLTSEVTSA